MSADDETITDGQAVADEEIVADYDVRSPASRTLLTVVGTILVVTVLVGLVLGFSILRRSTSVSTSDIQLGQSRQIDIDAGASDLRIVQGDADVVRVRAKITSGLRKTEFRIGRRGDQIKIVAGCKAWLNPGCGVDTTLELPKGFPVVVRTSSGNISVSDLAEGVLTIESGSGDVSGKGLRLDELDVRTGSGDIAAAFAEQPFGFKATTRDGDIRATLGEGKRKYAVTASSASGDVSSKIDSQRGGSGFIRAKTDTGDISLSR
jgi:hypothetical protein